MTFLTIWDSCKIWLFIHSIESQAWISPRTFSSFACGLLIRSCLSMVYRDVHLPLHPAFLRALLLRFSSIYWLAGSTRDEICLIFNLYHIIFALHHSLVILWSSHLGNLKLLHAIIFCSILSLIPVRRIKTQLGTFDAWSLLVILIVVSECFLQRRIVADKFGTTSLIVSLQRVVFTLVSRLSVICNTLLTYPTILKRLIVFLSQRLNRILQIYLAAYTQ